MTFTHALSTNNYGPSKFIVSASGANGTHTTIASALAVASSGDTIFIRNGIYTENLTLVAGVNLYAWEGDQFTPNVTIVGTLTMSYTGRASISGVRLQTNSANIILTSGANVGSLNIENCFLNMTNNTGIACSNANADMTFSYCLGNLGTTGIAIYAVTNGTVRFLHCNIDNTGLSVTANTVSAGSIEWNYSGCGSAITTSGTSNFACRYSDIDTSGLNITAFTLGGSGTNVLYWDEINSGTASAISCGSATPNISHCRINSSNANAISGAGTLSFAELAFAGTSKAISTTTQTALNSSTFTPALAFGGSSVGITYTKQLGKYYRQDNLITFSIDILTANKGAAVGAATITGMPFTSANDGSTNSFFMLLSNSVALATATYFYCDLLPNTATLGLSYGTGATTGATSLADTNFANVNVIRISGSYYTS